MSCILHFVLLMFSVGKAIMSQILTLSRCASFIISRFLAAAFTYTPFRFHVHCKTYVAIVGLITVLFITSDLYMAGVLCIFVLRQ